MITEIENKLYSLQMACNRLKSEAHLADWVLFAVTRHIRTGRASRAFERAFVEFPEDRFPEFIRKCLSGDNSDDGIIKKARHLLRTE